MVTFSAPPAKSLNTPRLALRQLNSVWLDEVEAMVNDPETSELTATTKTFSRQELETWLSSRSNQTDRCDWAILHQETGEFLGEVVLNELDDQKASMNLRIALAHSGVFGQGIGTEAIGAVLEYAFDQLELSKVVLTVLTTNPRAHRCYEKVGFVDGRQFNEGKHRWQRMSVTKLQLVEAIAKRELAKHLADPQWSFAYDNGKRRAGLCNYQTKTISLSRYVVAHHPIDDSVQVIWHEIAHALCGKEIGHGKVWLQTAKRLGYRAEKFSGNTIAENTAPWVGTCPAGHQHFRYRKPKNVLSCGLCGRGYNPANQISWSRVPTK